MLETFFLFLLLCWVEVHCGIYKSSYNVCSTRTMLCPGQCYEESWSLRFVKTFQACKLEHSHFWLKMKGIWNEKLRKVEKIDCGSRISCVPRSCTFRSLIMSFIFIDLYFLSRLDELRVTLNSV
jgi:hypothetical protein